MLPAVLPAWLDQGVATFLFALGIFLACAHTLLTALGARRAGVGSAALTLAPALVGAYLAVWLGIAVVAGDLARFRPGEPVPDISLVLVVGFGPAVVAAALLFGSRTLREINAAMPADWLIRIQVYRLAGGIFLYPFLYYGLVPAGFALPAAIGDMLTGALAPFVAEAVARGRRGAVGWAVAWNVFGIVDLIVAPAAAVLSQAQVLGLYPLMLVPLFIGPPLGILTHVYSLRNLANARGHGENADAERRRAAHGAEESFGWL